MSFADCKHVAAKRKMAKLFKPHSSDSIKYTLCDMQAAIEALQSDCPICGSGLINGKCHNHGRHE